MAQLIVCGLAVLVGCCHRLESRIEKLLRLHSFSRMRKTRHTPLLICLCILGVSGCAYREAEKIHETTLQSMAEVHALRGIVFLSERRFPAAERGFRQAIEMDHKNLEYHNYLGVVLYHRGRLPEALSAFDWVLKFDSGHLAALNNKARIHEELGQPEEARRCMEAFNSKKPLFEHYIGPAPVRPSGLRFPPAYLPHRALSRKRNSQNELLAQ